MSFDLKIDNGDLVIGANQDLDIVTDHAKLAQDVIKFVTTEKGSAKFQPAIGSLISQRLIGQPLTAQNSVTVLQSSVQEAVAQLQKLQRAQALTQALSPAETIVQINSIEVTRDSVEPRQLNVLLHLTAANGNLLTESFGVKVG